MTSAQPHSAEYFGDQRDFWWNADFVALMATRWRLHEARKLLELGSGVGHWSRVLAPHLAKGATLIGLEREETWIAEATQRAQACGRGDQLSYRQGDAMHLPFADGSFDLVTCQTVLMHLPDAKAALREALRVLKPGGLVAVAEPNNIGGALVLGSTRVDDDVDAILRIARLHILCERGKAALGLGYDSIGELLPGWFAEVGLTDVQTYQSDRASALVPPYATPAEQANVAQTLAWADRDFLFWSRDETLRYFLAGGGRAEEFDALWTEARAASGRVAAALRSKTEHQAGGSILYLVSGRKPLAR